MQTPSILHTMIAQWLDTQHALEREMLAARHAELDAIAKVLTGAPVAIVGVMLLNIAREVAADGRRLSNDVFVTAEAEAANEPNVRAELGLRPFGRALFEHPETRWILSVRWKEAPAVVEEVAA